MKKMTKLKLIILSFVVFQQGSVRATECSIQNEQESAKWTLTLDEEFKPLGQISPFMLFEPKDKSKILRIRFNVCPSKPSVANLFSKEGCENNSSIAMMGHSSFSLGVVAANDDETNKAKEIIDSINSDCQAEHDAHVAQEKAKLAEAGKKMSFSIWDCVEPVLPFRFLRHEQQHCFIASADFDDYESLATFINQFQVVYPELKSTILDEGYAEFAKRAELANSIK